MIKLATVSQQEVEVLRSKSVGWESAAAYDRFMGRWSSLAARKFIEWLDPPGSLHWFELGCGTGALTQSILTYANPDRVIAWEPSRSLLRVAIERIHDERAAFQPYGEDELADIAKPIDVFASGLVLNFLSSPKVAVEVAAGQLSPGGVAAGYVWDYSEGMEFLQLFWEAAISLDPTAAELDQRTRYPLCAPDALRSLFESASLTNVEVEGLEIETRFENFNDFWDPFLGGAGAAPTYTASLSIENRRRLEDTLRTKLHSEPGKLLDLRARVWAVRGSR